MVVSVKSTVMRFGSVLCVASLAFPAYSQELKTENDKVSYIIGHQLGENLKKNEAQISPDVLLKGLKEAMEGKKSQISKEDAEKIMASFSQQLQGKAEARRKLQAEKNLAEGKKFLEENAKKPGVKKLPSGLQYKVITEGKGTSPKATDTVVTNYRGTLIDGTEFDSSYKRNQPATFPVNGVIKGWTEALQLMKPGAKWQLFIPADLAYGEHGAGPDIGPNATLVFEIELLKVEEAPKAQADAKPATPAPTKKK